MADLRGYSREFLREFIELYRNFPALWKIKSKEYSNRDLKREAYDVMVAKLNDVDKNATKETVIKRINSLRTSWRKEVNEVNQY